MRHIAFWTQEGTPDESLQFITDLALSHAHEGGAQGKRIAGYIASGDFLSVCDFDLDYSDCSAWEARNCRQAIGFFKKYEPLDLGRDRRTAAIEKFKETEVACTQTNDIFRQRAQGSFSLEPWVESVLHRAQHKIARVLGDVPTPEDLKYHFGPGATTLTKKRYASTVEKLQAGISCSEDLLPLAARLLQEMPHLTSLHSAGSYCRLDDSSEWDSTTVFVTPGIVDFVPKDAKILRTIIKEGSLNTMIQLSIGDYMTKRLAAFGTDLRDQTVNQRHALRGSLDGSLATLDLSSASDTISTELVYNLLPIDWALLLDHARSSTVLLDGEPLALEKFSSMGNGFTFPLESLIFWALSSSAADDGFASVYGDDIVVSTPSVTKVMRLLEICGFTINVKKSYWTGPFRESCGVDYLRGIDIRPYYQKKLLSPVELFRLHNFYVRNGDTARADLVRDELNPCFHIYGPDGFGDGHLIGDWLPRFHKKRFTHGYGGALFDTFVLKGVRDFRALRPGDRVLPLYTIYRREAGESVLPEIEPRDLGALAGYLGRLRKFQSAYAPEPMPERVSPVCGSVFKTPSYPGTDGYKRVSIYTFDTAR